MALVLNDRVKETTTTTGTGTINLGGAATGFETFVAGVGNSNTTYYCIAGQGTAEFEVGIGTVTDASPDTLSRTTILSSSNSDSAVDFSAGTKDVFCTLPASKTIRESDTALNTPTGTTAQRSGSPAAGDLRFNTTTSKFEGYSGSAWGDIGVGNFLVTNTFTGDGSDTTFTISNAVADENNLLVFIDGVFQAQNVYSISGTTLTFATAPANGRVITVYSALNNIQGANVVKATMTGDNSDTTLALGITPISENAVQVYFDGVYQNKDSFSISGETLTFGVAPPTGVAVEAITLTVTDLAAAASSILVDEFTGDGSDTTFTLSAAPASENNTQVFVGGVYQEKDTYSVSGTTLTFSEAPANTVTIEVVSVAVGQINSAIQLSDADGDTKVMVEESADEDTIRMDIAGTEVLTLTNSAMTLKGTTPTLTIGDAGAEDTKIVFDGNAQDYYIGLDDSADDLIIGKGSAVGTTPGIVIDENLNVGIGITPESHYSDYTNLDFGKTGLLLSASSGTNITSLLNNAYLNSSTAWKYKEADEASKYDQTGGEHIFFTAASGSADATISWSERMRIDSSGNVGIGTTSPADILHLVSAAPIFKVEATNDSSGLRVDCLGQSTGQAFRVLKDTTTTLFTVDISGNVTAAGSISDERLKENISLIDNPLDKIKEIKGITYKLKESGYIGTGLIAQDLQKVLPEAVYEVNEPEKNDESYLAISYGNTVGLLVESIKEQQDQIETQQTTINDFKTTVEDLKLRIETLEG